MRASVRTGPTTKRLGEASVKTLVPPESHRDLLEGRRFAHLATNGLDGTPHSTPMWYRWDGAHLLLSTLTSRQKYRNLRRDPRVAVSILDPEYPYRYLQIRGIASLHEEGADDVIASLVSK